MGRINLTEKEAAMLAEKNISKEWAQKLLGELFPQQSPKSPTRRHQMARAKRKGPSEGVSTPKDPWEANKERFAENLADLTPDEEGAISSITSQSVYAFVKEREGLSPSLAKIMVRYPIRCALASIAVDWLSRKIKEVESGDGRRDLAT